MSAPGWTRMGVALVAVIAVVATMKTRSPQAPSSLEQGPPPTLPVATPVNPSDTGGPTLAGPALDEWPEHEVARVDETRPPGGDPQALLKSYEAAWRSPDVAKLRRAEEGLFKELEGLPPSELVGLLRQGLSARSVNLILITLENAMRGPRRSDYEDALVVAMEDVFEQPDKLEALSDVALRLGPSRENAEVAARLLMKRGPNGKLAEHLGGFASRLDGDSRREVKQFGVQHDLIEALGHLIEEVSDVVRLQGYLRDPATHDRAWRALETAKALVTDEELRRQIQRALGK